MSPKLKPPIKKIFPSVIYLFFSLWIAAQEVTQTVWVTDLWHLLLSQIPQPGFRRWQINIHSHDTFVWSIVRWDPQLLIFQKYQIKPFQMEQNQRSPHLVALYLQEYSPTSHMAPGSMSGSFPGHCPPTWQSQHLILVILQLVWQLNQYLLNLAWFGNILLDGHVEMSFLLFFSSCYLLIQTDIRIIINSNNNYLGFHKLLMEVRTMGSWHIWGCCVSHISSCTSL